MVDFSKPIEAVNVGGVVCPARVVATDVVTKLSRSTVLGLVLECGEEIPFRMNPRKDYGFMVASGRMLTIRNVGKM